MRKEIVPFRRDHLEEAANLLALRHRQDYAREPMLPERFTRVEEARAALEFTWNKPGASGVVALNAGQVIGYMIGVPRIDMTWGRSAWVFLPGHAIDPAWDAELYRDLYAALSPEWVARGCLAHYALIPASDQSALDAWFALSFGKEHAHGLRETAPITAFDLPADPSLEIRLGALDDVDASLELDMVIPRHQSRAPVYAPYWFGEYTPFADKEAWRQESRQILEEEGVRFWLALRAGRIVGFQLFMPIFPHYERVDMMMAPDQSSFLGVAATREEEQGRGVGRLLTARGLATCHDEGYTHCLTDWRATNLLSSRFWPRQDFRPVAYRLSRRLDDRITWSHVDPTPAPWRA